MTAPLLLGCVVWSQSGGLLTYMPDTKSPVADALSLVTINDVHILIHYQALAYEQQQDHHTAITNLQWQYISIDGKKLLCDVKTGRSRHIGSQKFQMQSIQHHTWVILPINTLYHPTDKVQVCMSLYVTVSQITSVSGRTAALWVNAAKYIGIPRQLLEISHNQSADPCRYSSPPSIKWIWLHVHRNRSFNSMARSYTNGRRKSNIMCIMTLSVWLSECEVSKYKSMFFCYFIYFLII